MPYSSALRATSRRDVVIAKTFSSSLSSNDATNPPASLEFADHFVVGVTTPTTSASTRASEPWFGSARSTPADQRTRAARFDGEARDHTRAFSAYESSPRAPWRKTTTSACPPARLPPAAAASGYFHVVILFPRRARRGRDARAVPRRAGLLPLRSPCLAAATDPRPRPPLAATITCSRWC